MGIVELVYRKAHEYSRRLAHHPNLWSSEMIDHLETAAQRYTQQLDTAFLTPIVVWDEITARWNYTIALGTCNLEAKEQRVLQLDNGQIHLTNAPSAFIRLIRNPPYPTNALSKEFLRFIETVGFYDEYSYAGGHAITADVLDWIATDNRIEQGVEKIQRLTNQLILGIAKPVDQSKHTDQDLSPPSPLLVTHPAAWLSPELRRWYGPSLDL